MFGDFMGKMQEAQKQMEETKKRLDGVYVDAEAERIGDGATTTTTAIWFWWIW